MRSDRFAHFKGQLPVARHKIARRRVIHAGDCVECTGASLDCRSGITQNADVFGRAAQHNGNPRVLHQCCQVGRVGK